MRLINQISVPYFIVKKKINMKTSYMLWQKHLGHMSYETSKRLEKKGTIPKPDFK